MTMTDDKSYSKAEMAGMVQASLSLCATCAHARGEHEGDTSCLASWETGGGEHELKVRHMCACREFWPIRDQREDGLLVRDYEVGFGGSVGLLLNRRAPTELWESLRAGQRVKLSLELEVTGKGFKQHKDFGLVETRKLSVVAVELGDAGFDAETGEVFE
jgi:hypothetical protein